MHLSSYCSPTSSSCTHGVAGCSFWAPKTVHTKKLNKCAMRKTPKVSVSEDGQGLNIEVPCGDSPIIHRSGATEVSEENALFGGGGLSSPVHPQCFLPYIKSLYFLELLMCLVYASLAIFLPPYVPLNQRPIPYQEISTGDIILNLELNHAYKPNTITCKSFHVPN